MRDDAEGLSLNIPVNVPSRVSVLFELIRYSETDFDPVLVTYTKVPEASIATICGVVPAAIRARKVRLPVSPTEY